MGPLPKLRSKRAEGRGGEEWRGERRGNGYRRGQHRREQRRAEIGRGEQV